MSYYPVKITRQPNDTYIWSCSIETEYHRKSMQPGLMACLGIAVFLLLFGAFLSVRYNDWSTFLIVAGCTAVFLLITFFFFGLAFSAADPQESYVLSETYVKNGYGKSSVYFNYRKARTAVFTPKYIELQGKMAKIRVYVPEEDFDFVKDYIRVRLPEDCIIRRFGGRYK